VLEILIVGAVSSAIYAMLAVGFTLIFGVARVLNLAHGSFYALGAYGAYFLTSSLKWPLLPRRWRPSRWWRCSAWRWSASSCGPCASRSSQY
jgi:branched-subunit amino acid ABC-type transport system permease component